MRIIDWSSDVCSSDLQYGEECLYMGREVPFDVGIIDLGLPKMSVMELVKQLREEGKQFPVLILTARSSWQDKVDGLKQGADDYLVKPFHVRSEEHTSELQSLMRISYAVFCLTKKKIQ